MIYKIDIKRIIDGNFLIEGWVLPKNPTSNVTFKVYDNHNVKIDFKLVRLKRDDVASIYFDGKTEFKSFGFNIQFNKESDKDDTYIIEIITENETAKEKINKKIVSRFNTQSRKKLELLFAYLNKNTFKRAFDFLFNEGLISFFKKTKRKLSGIDVDYDYDEWYDLTKKSESELEKERAITEYKKDILFSIVIPIYDTSDEFLKLLFDSILNQTYQKFEVCIADATDYSKAQNNPKRFFNELYKKDERLKNKIFVKYLDKNKSIADNTNIAIQMAKGDYVILCDHDDELTLDALYEMYNLIMAHDDAMMIYSDEDKVDTKDSSYFEPAFKSDFNLDMLLSVNYFCHLTCIKKSLLQELYSNDGTYERAMYNGAQDYDLFLRLVSIIINKTYNDGNYDVSSIYHIKKVLYHWRSHKKSTSKNIESKDYAFVNGSKAIEDFYKNIKINFPKISHVEKGFDYGLYHTVYAHEIEPLISVIIPNKDHVEDLSLTIESLIAGSYKNIEFIVCENNSVDKETLKYYDKLKDRKDVYIKVIDYKGNFNYSKINNFAYKYANSDYILFLNNDVEMINKDSLHEMVSYIKRDDVGAVGSKLLYKDKTFQHAGVIIGIGGIADHSFRSISDFDHTYMNRAHIVQDLNAVTAACLMTKRTIFDGVSGFDENIAVAFNDIDLCLKIRKLNKLIVYNPYSCFYHYESKSRGLEDSDEKVKRFNNEFAYFVKKWETKLKTIDEYYNPNLTLRKNNFALRDLKYEKIGEMFPIPDEIRSIMERL